MTQRKLSNFPSEGLNLESLMESLFYRDEFLSIASHELKTPLTSLKLQAQVFKRNAKKQTEKEYSREKVDRLVDQIDAQTTRLMKLVDDMLDISRIRSGQLTMTKNNFNLSELLHEVVGKIQQIETVQIITNVEPNIFLNADRDRIGQVFYKLINNAARYGNGLPFEVKLVTRKAKISFLVIDQGIGITEEDQKRIFHRFQRAIAASEISGLGLGLYIAREIVEAHGGKIKVKSQLGEGSTFSVDFKREEII